MRAIGEAVLVPHRSDIACTQADPKIGKHNTSCEAVFSLAKEVLTRLSGGWMDGGGRVSPGEAERGATEWRSEPGLITQPVLARNCIARVRRNLIETIKIARFETAATSPLRAHQPTLAECCSTHALIHRISIACGTRSREHTHHPPRRSRVSYIFISIQIAP